ncbi:putative membrane protein [Pseudoalteromonas translucida]|uniref:Membrane protein n=1 Tax=Pseudoalteromonas translucida (strain TAC 125) TaxID=326442 RepID=Q3II05_PSET1|nr:putative membrane protein [Pseudoalteromonas translucida]
MILTMLLIELIAIFIYLGFYMVLNIIITSHISKSLGYTFISIKENHEVNLLRHSAIIS